jgi:hypothetical protein
MISPKFAGQLTAEQLIDRYDLACRPVRDLLVDYLRERQPGIDYSTLRQPRHGSGCVLERPGTHHPGIDSLHLPPDIAAAWKQRLQTRTTARRRRRAGTAPASLDDALMIVRAFYLDLAQWALDDPARWGPWAVPCPVRGSDIQYKKQKSRTKARMDQRTRERLPVLPALAAAADRERKDAAARLDAARPPGPARLFTAGGQTLRRPAWPTGSPRIWAEDPAPATPRPDPRGRPRVLGLGRHRGPAPHRHPRRGTDRALAPQPGPVPAPVHRRADPAAAYRPVQDRRNGSWSSTPELADVLSAIITRIRGADGAVPLVAAYDTHERTWNPPMPLLFQRRIGLENRPIGPSTPHPRPPRQRARRSGLTGTGRPAAHFQPHDFRRLFTTDAILNGMPPHIAQLVVGHRDINTTMGYKAVYPEEAINGHRAFIARRRSSGPAKNTGPRPTRNGTSSSATSSAASVALGDCGRAYSPAASTSTPASGAPPENRPRPAPAGSKRSATTSRPHRRSRTRRLDRRSRRTQGQPRRRQTAKLAQADGLVARRPRHVTSASPPTATSPRDREQAAARAHQPSRRPARPGRPGGPSPPASRPRAVTGCARAGLPR